MRGRAVGACRWSTAMTIAAAILLTAQVVPAWRGPFDSSWSPTPRFVGPPFAVVPAPAFRPGYRLSLPPNGPLSFDEPDSGLIYCLSPSAGLYFVCGYARGADVPVAPAAASVSPDRPAAGPAAGLLVFRLSPGSEVAVDDVPVGVTDGLGAASVLPGRHRVVVRAAGVETRHLVDIVSHRLFVVTPSAVVPAEP